LNFANDTEMEERLEGVRRELLSRTAEEYRDSGFAQRKLRKGLSELAGKARELAQADATELVARFGRWGEGDSIWRHERGNRQVLDVCSPPVGISVTRPCCTRTARQAVIAPDGADVWLETARAVAATPVPSSWEMPTGSVKGTTITTCR